MKVQILVLSLALAAGAASAQGSVTVIGGGLAQACSEAALAGKSDGVSVRLCDQALATEMLLPHDRAGTYINRGVMKLRQGAYEPARTDLDTAIHIAPSIGEAWINRGAVNVAEKRYRDGLHDLSRGIELGVREPEKAYYNRALAEEGLDDEKSAYLDYQQAIALKPDWQLPQQELLRFTVTRR